MKRAVGSLALLSILGCEGASKDVLSTPTATVFVYDTCEEVLKTARKGDPCQFEEQCVAKSECLVETARCVNGVIFFGYEELPCPECTDDLECGGKALCIDGTCQPCEPPSACPSCPDGFTYLSRNDCSTCECGPPSECNTPSCPDGRTCSLGQVCAEGCQRLDCCANVCSEPGCTEPAPIGCTMPCDDPSCEGRCRAEYCKCDTSTGRWTCAATCANETAACVVP